MDNKKLYGRAILDNRPSQNVQDTGRSYDVHRGNHEKCRMGWTAGENTLIEVKIERYIHDTCAINVSICNRNDATQSDTKEMGARKLLNRLKSLTT